MKFKKILATVGSVLMLSSVIGGAFAAGLPTTLKADNTVIVQGTGSNDANAISTLQTELSKSATQGAVSVVGGETYKVEKNYEKLNLGEKLTAVVTSAIDDDDMSSFLATGKYKDSNRVETDYDQKITLGKGTVKHFADSKYNDKTPSLGLVYEKNDNVLTYTLSTDWDLSAIEGTDIPLMGKNYYVLEKKAGDTLILLDSSASHVVSEGDSPTISVDNSDYVVEVSYIENGKVKLIINGETTDILTERESFELKDGSWIAIKDILWASKESGTSKVEFTIGAGKIELGSSVKINDKTIKGLSANVNSNGIDLNWTVTERTFLTSSDPEISVPGFGNIKVIYGGVEFPEAEKTILNSGETLILDTEVKEGSLELPLFEQDRDIFYRGEENSPLVINSSDGVGNIVLNLNEDEVFIATYISNDKKEYATYVYELSSVENATATGRHEVRLGSLVDGGSDIELSGDFTSNKSKTLGKMEVEVANPDGDAHTATITLKNLSGSNVYSNVVVTKKGMAITLPSVNTMNSSTNIIDISETPINTTGVSLKFEEANREGTIKSQTAIDANITYGSEDGFYIANTDLRSDEEEISSKIWKAYKESELATSYVLDKSDSEGYDLEVSYFGEEIVWDIRVASGETSIGQPEAGDLIVADTDAAKMSGKNLIVVGGSAINSVAAQYLGFNGPAFGEAFTEKTGVSAGEYLIQSFDKTDGKVAIVVAGYNAADTENGAKFLALKDYVVGKKYKGTTADVAQEVTA